MGPDELLFCHGEVLQHPLGDDAGLHIDVIGPHLALNVATVLFGSAVKVLVAVVSLERAHVGHPEMIAEGAERIDGLLEGDFDFESQ